MFSGRYSYLPTPTFSTKLELRELDYALIRRALKSRVSCWARRKGGYSDPRSASV